MSFLGGPFKYTWQEQFLWRGWRIDTNGRVDRVSPEPRIRVLSEGQGQFEGFSGRVSGQVAGRDGNAKGYGD